MKLYLLMFCYLILFSCKRYAVKCTCRDPNGKLVEDGTDYAKNKTDEQALRDKCMTRTTHSTNPMTMTCTPD